ncbi:MAG: esterase-like activity of phytase family protein [Hyphomicrobiales bacterium]|nr:esterase-like activity of phytase family protein [Hyphomicrobiales bacterium]MCA1999033.1 esterase-like activity of phytase family protein [Hyphomicrobiales bacterium]
MHRAALVVLLALSAPAAGAAEIARLRAAPGDPAQILAPVTLPGGRVLAYTIGIGSGAFRHPTDPADVIWTVGDRGPNMTCAEAEKLLSPEIGARCKREKNGRVYPVPGYAPSIYRVALDRAAGTFRLVETIPVKTKSGRPITGLLNPQTKATKDTGLDLAGNVLPDDPDNLDLEGIVRLADGTFWIGEEMGPSIAELSADGRILRRFVPADQGEDYKRSEAEIHAVLPAILSKRQGNRGIESLAVSPDEAFLYFIVQNPLANPDAKTFNAARNTRLFKFDRRAGAIVGEWVYQLDDPRSFARDPSDRQSDPRISELTALGPDRLLVLERTERTTKLYEIRLAGATDIRGSAWDDPATRPTLEQTNDLAGTGIVPLAKTLRLDSARDIPDAPEKIEGVAFLGDGALVLINDNDFGIRGDETRILVVRGLVTADPEIYRK